MTGCSHQTCYKMLHGTWDLDEFLEMTLATENGYEI